MRALTLRRSRRFALWLGLGALVASVGRAEPPFIDHQAIPCSLPQAHPRICATIADDGTVKRAKLFFRAAGQSAWYWSEMVLDFRSFCATLPRPEAETEAIDYYLWAMDDAFETERTRDFRVPLDGGCAHPVIDDDPERISHLEIHATVKKQKKKLYGFVDQGVDFHPLPRQ